MRAIVLFLMFVVGGGALSVNASVSPQDPAFLDYFNDHQKQVIYQFLSQQLGEPTSEVESGKLIDEDQLKRFFVEHLERWRSKFGIAHSLNKNNQKSHSMLFKQINVLNPNNFSEKLLGSFKACKSKAHSSSSIAITPDDIGSKGIIIKKPGHYRLCTKKGVLHWKPSKSVSMITIDADNVILDLNDSIIVQKPNSNFASTAINILPGHKNITIRNGSLDGFTADAILGASADQLLIENMLITDNINRQAYAPNLVFASINLYSCLNVALQNINVSGTIVNSSHDILGAGILILNTGNFLIENCKVTELEVDAGTISQSVGISTILSFNGVIRNCNVSDCTSSGIMAGLDYVFAENILTENCIANYNTGIQTTSGYYPQISDSLQFINCEANNNRSNCQDCHGFPYFISSNGFFSNCRALNNAAVNSTGGFNEKATGFEILVCINCVVENCEASNNIATNPIRHYAAGFANGNSTNVVFRDCVSIGNIAIGNVSRGVGFGPALDPRFSAPSIGTIWENCIAEGNFGDAQSIGFDLFGQIGAILSGSVSQNHGSVAVNNGIGILSNGSYDEGNPVDVPCDVVPVVVITANSEANVLVKANTITNNSLAGIVDTTTANNVYIDNTAFNNGINFVGPIFSAGTPIRDWTIQSPPSNANNNGVVGDKLDNLNVTTP